MARMIFRCAEEDVNAEAAAEITGEIDDGNSIPLEILLPSDPSQSVRSVLTRGPHVFLTPMELGCGSAVLGR